MSCPVCGRAMLALLTSLVCEHCSAPRRPASRPDWPGFVVLGERDTLPGHHLVFATRADAERFHQATRTDPVRIARVGAHQPFKWVALRQPRGLIAAEREHEIVDDLALEPTPGRAFVIPSG